MLPRLFTPLLLLLSFSPVYPFPQPSPSAFSTTVCNNLTPGHGGAPQATPSPYSVTFHPTTYTPGQATGVTVTLRSCTTAPFLGFLIQARSADNTKPQTAVGRFETITGTQRTCGGTSLSHTTSAAKTTLQFQWIPPPAVAGHIVFRVTFVQQKLIYWVDVKSQVLQDSTSSAIVSGANIIQPTGILSECTTIPSTPVPTSLVSATTTATPVSDPACGTTKGCFSKCEGANCEFVVSWRPVGDDGEYTLKSTITGSTPYLALGFSSDKQMGGDDVIGCASTGTGTIKVFSSRNTGKSSTVYTDTEVQLMSSSLDNNILTCTIRRPKSASGNRKDIETLWILLFARGSATVGGDVVTGIGYHGATNRFVSSEKFTINNITDTGSQTTERILVKYHGSFMTIAWLFFASIGIFMPRYFKNAWKDDLCAKKAWFQMHRMCMVLVLCLTSAGFVIIFVEIEEWSELVGEDSHLQAHPIMGTVVMGLTLLNPIMALFRPAPDASNRKIFNVLHYLVGQGGYTLAVVTVYFGVLLDVADTPYFVFYILIGYSAWSFVVEILMSISSYCFGSTDKREVYELGKGVVEEKTRVEGSQGLQFKKILLGLHIVVAACISGTVVAMIAIGEEELDK